ncbi:unknown [Ruminococcus sp. CAG:330]|nr:unknown [Ruminococcus sp. CAG:330]
MGADDGVAGAADDGGGRCLAGAFFQQLRTAAPVDRNVQTGGLALQNGALAAIGRYRHVALRRGRTGIIGVDVGFHNVQSAGTAVGVGAAAVHKANAQVGFCDLIGADGCQQQHTAAEQRQQKRQQNLHGKGKLAGA